MLRSIITVALVIGRYGCCDAGCTRARKSWPCAAENGYCRVPYPTRVFYGVPGRVVARDRRPRGIHVPTMYSAIQPRVETRTVSTWRAWSGAKRRELRPRGPDRPPVRRDELRERMLELRQACERTIALLRPTGILIGRESGAARGMAAGASRGLLLRTADTPRCRKIKIPASAGKSRHVAAACEKRPRWGCGAGLELARAERIGERQKLTTDLRVCKARLVQGRHAATSPRAGRLFIGGHAPCRRDACILLLRGRER